MQCEEVQDTNENSERDNVISARLEKAEPRETPMYENVGPERRRRRIQVKVRQARRRQKITKIAEKDRRTRRQIDKQTRSFPRGILPMLRCFSHA